MGRYLDLARETLADLKDGPMKLSTTPESPKCPQSDNALEYEINESNEKRVSPFQRADPTNPAVQAARSEAERLGVLDVRFPIDNGSDVSFNLADESTAEERMWAELATMPPTVLRDRACRTDHPETKRRLLALAGRKPTVIQTDVNNEDGDAIPF